MSYESIVEALLYLTVVIVGVVIILVSNKTKEKGLHFYDAFLAGVFIYFIGSVFLFFENSSNGVYFLSGISFITLMSSLLLWVVKRLVMRDGVTLDYFRDNFSRNNLFVMVSIVFVMLINFVFIYFVYERIIKGHFSGVFALLDVRKTISSGEAGYFYPGIIKQIRDIFAPALIVYLLCFYNGKAKQYLVALLMLGVVAAMIFGGQRMPVLALFLAVTVAAIFRRKSDGKKLRKGQLLVLALVPVSLVFGLNILLGRTQEDVGLLEGISNMLTGILVRVFSTVPGENLHLLPYLESLDFSPFSLWLADLSILLPGTQIALSNDLHSYLGGSHQGNAVLGLPLDIYVNSGWYGLAFVPFLALALFSFLQSFLLSKKNPLAVSIFIVVFCYVPFCYSLYLFILNGGVLVVFYSLYDFLVVRKRV